MSGLRTPTRTSTARLRTILEPEIVQSVFYWQSDKLSLSGNRENWAYLAIEKLSLLTTNFRTEIHGTNKKIIHRRNSSIQFLVITAHNAASHYGLCATKYDN